MEYDCKIGGHPWRYATDETVLDDFGRSMGYGISYGGEVSKVRFCPVCKLKQVERIEWRDMK